MLAQYVGFTEEEVKQLCQKYDMNFAGLKDAIISMLGGMRCKNNFRTFQNNMTSFQGKYDVLTLLVHFGYLAYDIERREVFISNQEFIEQCDSGRNQL